MSRINDLIQELCPDGVIFEPLSKLFNIRNGYTPAKSNAAFWDGTGTVPWFRMEDIRRNGRILDHAIQTVPVSAVKNGILFPANSLLIATSATIGEHALITVPHLSNQRFMSLSLKPAYKESLNIRYLYYYFFILDEWCLKNTSFSSFASVNMSKFKRFRIPIPPMEIQEEIVRILDSFTSLEAELEAELASRREQYNYYRDNSMIFDLHNTSFMTLGDFGTVFGGLTGKSKADFGNVGEPYVTYSNVYNNKATDITAHSYVQIDPAEHQNTLQQGDILLTGSSETPNEVALSSVITKPVDNPLYLNSFTIGIRPKQPLLDLDFAKHLFRSAPIRRQLIRTASGVTRFNVSKSRLAKVMIPIPDREIQENIATELDKFDVLANSLYSGLPAEIEARHKQYEYYRNRLLTFKELDHE